MPGIQQFNLGGGASPASPQDVYPLMERMIASMDSAAERIGGNIRQSMMQNQANSQAKDMANDAQALLQQNGNNPQALMGGLIQLNGKYPLGAQTAGGQNIMQMLGSSLTDMMTSVPNPVTGNGSSGGGQDSMSGQSGSATGTTFATPKDVANYAQTGSLKTGDNGVGLWGDATTTGTGPAVAVPQSVLEAKFGPNWKQTAKGQQVTVSYGGKTITAPIKDVGGRGIDLNPDAAGALGIKDPDNFKDKVSFSFGSSAPQTGSSPQSNGALDTLGARMNMVDSQITGVNRAIASLGPNVTGRAKIGVLNNLLRQREVLEGHADTLAAASTRTQSSDQREADKVANQQANRKDREEQFQQKEQRYWADYGQRQSTINSAAQARAQATTAAQKKEADENFRFAINGQMRALTEQNKSARQEKAPKDRNIGNLDIDIKAATDKDKAAAWQAQKEDLQEESNNIQEGIDRRNGEMSDLQDRLSSMSQEGGGDQPVQIKSTADYQALASGTVYIDPNGVKRTKP